MKLQISDRLMSRFQEPKVSKFHLRNMNKNIPSLIKKGLDIKQVHQK